MGACSPCSIIFHVLSLLQVGLAVAICIIVGVKLQDVSFNSDNLTFSYSCLLGSDYGSSSLCTYTYAVAGISLAVSALVSLVQCCTCNLCGLGKIIDVILAAFGTAWWAIASGVIASNVSDTITGVDPAAVASVQSWRDAIPIMCYVETGLFAGMFVSGLFRCCSCCRG
ncbi:transmembrane of CMA family [Chlorella sorokiniana]|uniref:Transmembrane of CMA family n=1 Tax=Chlorella sorokiniana TaxID=3076 RepID=A0A2P6U0Y3_CHLSO|nr:transmembrane of CMA family [Chlorella sorokiniana]|eukprot:PRW59976.1 transmembrane of CMA family [Chlorella sorokiniana]